MSNEYEDSARGQRAFQEFGEVSFAFDAVRGAILRTLEETPVGADVKVLKLHQSLQNLAAVRKAIGDTIDNGRMADATIAARNAVASAGLTRPF